MAKLSEHHPKLTIKIQVGEHTGHTFDAADVSKDLWKNHIANMIEAAQKLGMTIADYSVNGSAPIQHSGIRPRPHKIPHKRTKNEDTLRVLFSFLYC